MKEIVKKNTNEVMLVSENERMLSQIIQAGRDPDFNADKMKAMLEMHEHLLDRDAKTAYAAAMAKFTEIKDVICHNRSGKGPGNAVFGYADYPTSVKKVTPWMTQCGLSFSHHQDNPTFKAENGSVAYIIVRCRITHEKGHSEEYCYPAVPDLRLSGKLSPSQLIQLAITYAKRQTLLMGLGIATGEDKNDDDTGYPVSNERISDAQLASITADIDKWIKHKNKFLSYVGVDRIADMTVAQFDKALIQIDQIRNKKETQADKGHGANK